MKTIIHVNQHNIKYNNNRMPDDHRAVLTCKTYKSNVYGFEVDVLDALGNVCGTFKYRPDKPLSCGAKVWFETENDINIVNNPLD